MNFNLPSSIPVEPSIIVPEQKHKRHRLDSNVQDISTESTITIIPTIEKKVEEAPRKKTKTETHENQSKPKPPVVNEPVVEKETVSELPISVPSTNGRLKELKSKTPAWKSQTPAPKGNVQGTIDLHISLFLYFFLSLRETSYPI